MTRPAGTPARDTTWATHDATPLRRLAALAGGLVLALGSCQSVVVDQRYYDDPDDRGIQPTQVILRGAPDEGSPAFTNLVGYTAYRKMGTEEPARAVLLLIPEWSFGAGWLDPLARDLVATCPGLEVWTLQRRQVLLHGLIGEDAPSFVRDWGLDIALADLDRVVERAHDLGLPVVLGGFSTGGGLEALYHAVTRERGEFAVRGLVLFDTALGPNNERDRRDMEEGGAFVRHAFENGATTMPFLNPRLQIGVRDLALLVQAAELAETQPNEPSPLAPALAQGEPKLPAGRWTNETVFAWLLNRSDEGAWHPLGHAFGFHFADIVPPSGAEDEVQLSTDERLPYTIADALLPFRSPGGAVEFYPPLRFWYDLVERLGSTSFVDRLNLERRTPRVTVPMLYVASSSLRAHWDALGMERSTQGTPPEVDRLLRTLGNGGDEVLQLDGDFHATMLDAPTRRRVSDALASFLDRVL